MALIGKVTSRMSLIDLRGILSGPTALLYILKTAHKCASLTHGSEREAILIIKAWSLEQNLI